MVGLFMRAIGLARGSEWPTPPLPKRHVQE
jgi:hypothetical protein